METRPTRQQRRRRFATRPALAALALSSASLPALAGIKYWDNPDFKAYDVGDYVQDGLVVNYDAIRNAGPGKDHDPDATTWVNAANPGTYDMTRYSLVDGALAEGSSKGYWTATGFVFAKDAVFREPANFTIPKVYSSQVLLEATAADQSGIGYVMCGYNANNWNQSGLGIRSTSFSYPNNQKTDHAVAKSMYVCATTSAGGRAAIEDSSFSYATAILNGTDIVLFSGTKAPWTAANGGWTGRQYSATATAKDYTVENGICLGGHYPTTSELFKGTLRSYRFYAGKALSDEEVAWNRVVDEARFFNRRGAIPVTNVVVAVTIDGVEDDHFALDAEGYTFTAPSSRTVAGKRYALGGYTLETWNGSAWTGATTGTGASVTLSDASAKVRLTWNYARPAGEGQLAHYDVSDYVQKDLVLHYDGIFNDGLDKPHAPFASQWQNIAPGYSQWPMDWVSYVPTSGGGYQWTRYNCSQGTWTDNGFAFNGYGYFAKWGSTPAFPAPAQFTMQFALEGSFSDLAWGTQYLFLPSTGYVKGSVGLRTSNFTAANGNANSVYMIDTTAFPSARPNFYPTDKKLSYANFVIDSETGHAFEGTTPTDATTANVAVSASPERNLGWFSFGGFHDKATTAGTSLECFKGVIHDFRFYNRALEEADLVQNRKVDEYRYYGRYIVTNILVQSTYSYLQGNETDGPYEVVDSYTFTAPETVTADNGNTYEPDGYVVETWDGANWSGATTGEGAEYRYKTSYGLQRLTWKWKAVRGIRSAADYSFADLSQAGLALHYDGKFNAGVDAAHAPAATKWVNLGSEGASADLSKTTRGNAAAAVAGEWTDDGYAFKGKEVFLFSNRPTSIPTSYAIQVLVDVDAHDQLYQPAYLFSGSWNKFAMGIRNSNGRYYVNAQGKDNDGPAVQPYVLHSDWKYDFVTYMLDDNAKTLTIFDGAERPSSGTGYHSYGAGATLDKVSITGFGLGAYGSANGSFYGTVKNFRYYDRVLTDEELARNRNVDAARYFGVLGVTNLVVAVEDGLDFKATPAAGEYYVEGAWDFAAAAGADKPTGYKLEDWDDETGAWTNPRFVSEPTFAYVAADATAPKQRITWRAIKPLVFIVR